MNFHQHDVAYALEMTRVLHVPDRRIDTFGTTDFQFVLISELMDQVDRVRVRSGRLQAGRPVIMRPDPQPDMTFEGFGDQAEAFRDWIKAHHENLAFLRYGFTFSKSSVTESLLHEPFESVQGRLVAEAVQSGNPMRAVIAGVDDTWEISLLRFSVEMIQKSSGINIFDFKRRGLL
ncbi:MAG: hypothetical protein ACKV19_04265 [Verrucomicrobiales bacterium]